MPKSIYELYPNFYNNPLIHSIGLTPKWSISDENKRPIDLVTFAMTDRIVGCDPNKKNTMVTLPQSVDIVGGYPSNHAFFLEAATDGFMILDIEPSCPANLKSKFLQMPYIYGETSLSGKGYHLLFPIPKNYNDFPIAKTKIKMQDKTTYYEILMNHWVTFTRNMLPPAPNPSPYPNSWEDTYAYLASQQTKSEIERDIDYTPEDITKIPDYSLILTYLTKANQYIKSPKDFFGNMSSYEFGYMSHKLNKLNTLLKATKFKNNGHTYTDQDKITILSEIASEELDYRPKHDEFRQNIPWLTYVAKQVVAKNSENDSKGH